MPVSRKFHSGSFMKEFGLEAAHPHGIGSLHQLGRKYINFSSKYCGRFPFLLHSIPVIEKHSPELQKLLLTLVPYYDAILSSFEGISEITAEIILSFVATPCNALGRRCVDGHEYMYITIDPRDIRSSIDIKGIRAFAIPHGALESASICDFPEDWLIPLVKGNDYFRSHRKMAENSLSKAATSTYTEAVTLFALAAEEGLNVSSYVHQCIKKYRKVCKNTKAEASRPRKRKKRRRRYGRCRPGMTRFEEFMLLNSEHYCSQRALHRVKLSKFEEFINLGCFRKNKDVVTKRGYDTIVASLIFAGAHLIYDKSVEMTCTMKYAECDVEITMDAGMWGISSAFRGATLIQKPELLAGLKYRLKLDWVKGAIQRRTILEDFSTCLAWQNFVQSKNWDAYVRNLEY